VLVEQEFALPLGHGIALKYIFPEINVPRDIAFCDTVTLQIIAPPGSTKVG
jgi:hypothetical protein